MKRFSLRGLAIAGTLVLVTSACRTTVGELVIRSPGETIGTDFSGFRGAGFAPAPGAGQLDSTAWRVGGFSDGSLDYGDIATTGDFARGDSAGGITSGGTYAFEVVGNDWALGVQATGSDFNPGWMELRVTNQTGVTLSNLSVAYDLYTNNDQNRSSRWDVGFSVDGASYTELPQLSFISPAAKGPSRFMPSSWTTTIPASISQGGSLYLRWSSRDSAGSGSRDEFALDNVLVTAPGASAVPEPASLTLWVCAFAGILVLHLARRSRQKREPAAAMVALGADSGVPVLAVTQRRGCL